MTKIPQHFLDTLAKLKTYLATHPEEREALKECPACGANIQDRKVSLFASLIRAMYKVYCYLGEQGKHEFCIKEVKDLMGKNEYARFGDLVRFGGIIYKPVDKKGEFGMNMQRAREFFGGERQIPVQIVLNQITNEIEESHYVSITDFPELHELLLPDGLYDHEKTL